LRCGARVNYHSSIRLQRGGQPHQELFGCGGIEVAKAVPETEGAIELGDPAHVAHVRPQPLDRESCSQCRLARRGEEIVRNVDAGDLVIPPRELNGMPAVPAWNVQQT